eukprot:3734519-Pleurochrysis_carterae.AAC.4
MIGSRVTCGLGATRARELGAPGGRLRIGGASRRSSGIISLARTASGGGGGKTLSVGMGDSHGCVATAMASVAKGKATRTERFVRDRTCSVHPRPSCSRQALIRGP